MLNVVQNSRFLGYYGPNTYSGRVAPQIPANFVPDLQISQKIIIFIALMRDSLSV